MPTPRFAFVCPLFAGFLCLFLSACSESDQTTFTIYDSSTGPVKGWSHIVTQPNNFPLVVLENDKYAVDASSMVEDGSTGAKSVFRTVLVRKMSNWGQQHANGLEPVFFETPLLVEDVQSVTIRLKLNSKDSRVPNLEQLSKHYEGSLSSEQVEALDNGAPCIGLSFFEDGYNDQSVESLNAIYSLEFDSTKDFDKWLEITVKLEDFTFGFEQNYSLREVEQGEVTGRKFVGFRINPETTGGGVARNFIGDKWDDTVPELYKELSISLERIEAMTTKKGGE